MKLFKYLSCLLPAMAACISMNAQGQHDIGRNFSTKGFIQNIDYEEKAMVVNFPDKENNQILSEFVKLDHSSFLGKKNKDSLGITGIRCNDEILLEGQRFTEDKYTEATVVTLLEKTVSQVKKGKIDSIQGEICYIDGNKVKLAEGKKIKGKKGSDYATKLFDKISDMKPNDYANIDGKYDPAGYYLADEFTVYPYDPTGYDKIADTVDRFFYEKFASVWNDKVKRSRCYNWNIPGIGKVSGEARLQDYVQRVGMKLVPERIKKKKTFVFVVVENSDFNANMRANGLCYVYTGLLKELDNEAQLAAVIGHEIAHVLYEHVSTQLKNAQKAGNAKALIEDAGTVGKNNMSTNTFKTKDKESAAAENDMLRTNIDGISLLISASIERQQASYSVDQESQADRVGLSLMALAGYDPREATIMWKTIYNKYGQLSTAGINKSLVSNLRNEAVKPKTAKGKPEKKKTDKEKAGAFANLLIKWKIADASAKKYKTHPENLERFADLNRLVSLYWNNDSFLQQVNTGEEEYNDIVK